MPARTVARALVVEDHAALREAVVRSLQTRVAEVKGAATVAEAVAEIAAFRPELLVLDVELPDGTAVDVMRAALETDALPVAVAMSGAADREHTFKLAQLGVRAYVEKPIDGDALERAVETALSTPPDLAPHLRESVGSRPIHDVEEEVRRTMLREALARSGGSKRGAARLLQVTRQLVQHMLRRHEDL